MRSVELSDLIWLSVERRTRGQPGPCKVKDPSLFVTSCETRIRLPCKSESGVLSAGQKVEW